MGTTQIQNIDILFGTIILFGFIILFAMAFGFVWLQDRIYDKCREMRNEIRETNNKIYTESREIKDEIIKTKWN